LVDGTCGGRVSRQTAGVGVLVGTLGVGVLVGVGPTETVRVEVSLQIPATPPTVTVELMLAEPPALPVDPTV